MLSKVCIVEVKVFVHDFITNNLMVLGCNLMDCEPKLEGLHTFVTDLDNEDTWKILDVKYKTRDMTIDDNPKKYGVTIH